MTTAEIILEVPTADLRRALGAVARFANPKVPDMSCVRLRATDHITYVSATNGSAAALAISSTIGMRIDLPTDDPVAEFDLSVEDVAKILKVFKGSDGDDDNPGEELRIEVDAEHVTLTDASGMFEGQQLVLPRQPHNANAPSVMRSLGALIHDRPKDPPGSEVFVFGPNLALFLAASKVYDTNLTIEHHLGGKAKDRVSLVVRVGGDFIGALTTRWEDDDEKAARQRQRNAWTKRLTRPIDLEGVWS